jgi:ornithine carbamoyltransferase
MRAPKDFISLADWPVAELRSLLERASELKRLHRSGQVHATLPGRTLAMYFEKPSLRTQVTFEAGIAQLGGHAIPLRPEQVGIGTRESVEDVARNLARWVHGLVARTYEHRLVEALAAAATIPVINGLTDALHPCQAMADLLTVAERAPLREVDVVYVGDGNNVAASLALAWAKFGGRLRVSTPASHRIETSHWERALKFAEESGASLQWSESPREAVEGADYVYTDVWTSMGQEEESETRKALFRAYQVNRELLEAAPAAMVLHCLPAHRGEEITSEVLDGPRSLALDQAENRLHAQKAILERVLGAPVRGG